ncbi:Probable enoyl-CoA hydratase echA8 [Achromobacter xylosoxidans]|uniref:enoyl-CoA hydratase/isomerase family protein n=1 Tax=Alcaligenes xylosoxydans xylosoxydans TaxID=85698 RepID=UPI0006C0F77A|nr:enoyl-CoA hydratase-related protein [Achromobacter xylosoxidans]CUI70642.1 Probable enoyl-CoA hydratase echA8 [Achromobacter xylosoxidans]
MSAELTYRDGVAILTLNRPKALNALNAEMIGEISNCLDEVAVSDARALLIVGGGGGKAFCAGADVSELQGKNAGEQRDTARRGQLAFAKLDRLRIPSVAVIIGVAFGGGLELAMACTFRIATPSSRLGLPEIKLGLLPGYGGTQRLPRLVGVGRAVELIASGRAIDAQEAERIGLIHRIVEVGDPIDAGVAYLKCLGEPFPASLGYAIEAIRHSQSIPLEAGFQQEAECFSVATQTGDAAEGVSAFLGKRKPLFTGR